MPTITLNKEVLLKRIGKVDDDKLKHYISYLGTDLDSIDDKEIVVEIFPNRPDLLSEQGFCRALETFIGKRKGLSKFDIKPSGEEIIIHPSVRNYRAYTACAIVKGLKLNNEKIIELVNIQEKLCMTFGRNRKKMALGVYPMEKIKFPISYKAVSAGELKFWPLEGSGEMNAKQILENHSKGKEYGKLIEGHDKYTVFLDADSKVLSWTPITNSHDTGKIDESTTDMFIECTGPDFAAQMFAINMMAAACADMGGKVYSMKMKYGNKTIVSPNLTPFKMKYDLDYVNTRLGLDLKDNELKALLEKMGYGHVPGHALVPAYRADILHQVDLVEDIAIGYGYDKFKEEIPDVATIGAENPLKVFQGKIVEILAGHGLIEVKNYCMSNESVQNKMMKTNLGLVKLSNSLSQDYDMMRAWIIPCLLKTLSENTHREYPQNIFETGTIFKKANARVDEAERVAVALCGEDANYTKVKQVLDSVLDALDIDYEYTEAEHPSFVAGRVARVSVGKGVAYIGEIHPQILTNFNLEMPVAVFELNITDLMKKIK